MLIDLRDRGDPDANTHCLTSQHIISATSLPTGHPVCGLLAAAAVEGYLRRDNYEFSKKAKELHNFSVDLLKAVKATFKTLTHNKFCNIFKDSSSGETLDLKFRYSFGITSQLSHLARERNDQK
jgi:hypothetical protein